MKKYTILTALQVYNTDDLDALIQEQEEKLKIFGIDYYNGEYLCHFFDSAFFDDFKEIMELPRAIECLAIKDGVDLVQWEDGNIGYIAYYNGIINGFEIIG